MATIVSRYVDKAHTDTIYLCGGTCCLTGIEDIFQKVTGIRTIKPANPFLVTPTGIAMNCKGSIGPVDWCYMDTVKELGYFKEMRTDAVMDQLPDGYFQFWYPEP